MEKKEQIKEIVELQEQADNVLRSFSPEPWIDLNLTIAQLKSLFFITAKGKTNFKKLADALGVTPPNITGIIDRLVEQGLVSRTENPEDRRVMLLQTTEKGLKLLNNLSENSIHHMTQILSQLRPEELSYLSKGLNALVKAAKAYNVSKE